MTILKEANNNFMDKDRQITILRNALNTILLEAKEPIIKVYAQSALDETKEIPEKNIVDSNYCKKHNWYGTAKEKCPICMKSLGIIC